MTQAMTKREITERLLRDRGIDPESNSNSLPIRTPRMTYSQTRALVDTLPIIRQLGERNLHGWEMEDNEVS